ncbi:dTDP-4-dehydrorhamnose reductase [Patiriisocius hiemis]|uniref:dTDP-4-dehydrorhamnose reductase n=1 Tax=Patiriisocius hiemis TaxID=3075604 RepID=A0ABU2YCS7_9FLAO|nr:dTDP-4-dehydrorhamnose reductase [Constantimarinum sp. W242]MDT0555572.1 dTDP-4-dehydrorhamnose reductase [Constantimarinum sp. W242]
MKKILVTGANGQLGKCLKDASEVYPQFQFTFASREQLDISDKNAVSSLFASENISHCINAAAYTNVDKAESEKEQAFAINAEAVKQLAQVCSENNTILYHISTDYVFDGTNNTPYIEEDEVNPINVYGASKLEGELNIQDALSNYFIIRTSWLYSQYGHNFMNSMIRFAREGRPLTITTEQTGVPTNANDLAKAILKLIANDVTDYGVYHFSNKGEATWYDFAKAILENTGLENATTLAKTDYYATFAKRPVYSILDTNKIKKFAPESLVDWKQSLQYLIEKNLTANH